MADLDPWLLSHLSCPRGHGPLTVTGQGAASEVPTAWLGCPAGCTFPVVDGVPVLLRDDVPKTIGLISTSIREARRVAHGEPRAGPLDGAPWWLASTGMNDTQRAQAAELAARWQPGDPDPIASFLVAATNGFAYEHLVGKLERLPIPDVRLPPGEGRRLLDIGCSWGRWTTAASMRGYRVVGLDPSLGGVLAARRVARSLGFEPLFVVADARYLPFADHTFETVFSNGVIQHFSFADATQAIHEVGRVLQPGGHALMQMANRLGVRSLQHLARRRFHEGRDFEVRYWSVPRLLETFRAAIGETDWSVDCYFGLGLQPADLAFMSPTAKVATRLSERLRHLSKRLPVLRHAADSVYLEATRR